MSARDPGGRFDVPFERRSIIKGTTEELVRTVGQEITWWRWDATATQVDDVYDVGSIDGGRVWHPGVSVPTVNTVIMQGVTLQDVRGFYNTDVLRCTLNMDVVERFFGTMPTSTDDYLRDRITFRNQVFRPTHFYPRGLITDKYTLFTLDATQINPEELVNDQQFLNYISE